MKVACQKFGMASRFLFGQTASKVGGAIAGVLIPSALEADGMAAVSRKDGMNIAYLVI